jgi:hypothetical protein
MGWILESTSASIDRSFPIESAICVCELINPGINSKLEQSIDFSFDEIFLEIFLKIPFLICTSVDSMYFNSVP